MAEERKAAQSYEDKLRKGVSQEDATTHYDFLDSYGIPLEKKIDQLVRWGPYQLIFDRDEQKLVSDFRRLLKRKMVPMALVEVIEPEPRRRPRRPRRGPNPSPNQSPKLKNKLLR